jgi:hypothetical protein
MLLQGDCKIYLRELSGDITLKYRLDKFKVLALQAETRLIYSYHRIVVVHVVLCWAVLRCHGKALLSMTQHDSKHVPCQYTRWKLMG